MFVNKEKIEKGIKIFCLCCIMMNLQEKPQSNMATLHFQTKPALPFCLNPPFSVKIFRTLPPPPPPHFHQFWISWAPALYEGGGEGLHYGVDLRYVWFQSVPYPSYFFISAITLPLILRVSTIRPLLRYLLRSLILVTTVYADWCKRIALL